MTALVQNIKRILTAPPRLAPAVSAMNRLLAQFLECWIKALRRCILSTEPGTERV
jgi:hypothetical protein